MKPSRAGCSTTAAPQDRSRRRRSLSPRLLLLASGYFWLIGAGRGMPQRAAIGGPFELVQGDGQTVTDRSLPRQVSVNLFRLYLVRGRMPGRAHQHGGCARHLGPQGRPNPAAVHHGRSRARHPGSAMQRYASAFMPQLGRPDRLARSGPQGHRRIPARWRCASRWSPTSRTTPSTITRSSIWWARMAATSRRSGPVKPVRLMAAAIGRHVPRG